MKAILKERFAQLMERVKKLQKTLLGVKKLANSELLDAFIALISAFFTLFTTVPDLCKTL
jgi:hypothetical protein